MPLKLLPLLLAAVLLSAPAIAKDRKERDDTARDQRSLSDSVRQVERNTGGRVVGAEKVRGSGREINRVKVVTPEGRVRVIRHDPESGGDRSARRERDE